MKCYVRVLTCYATLVLVAGCATEREIPVSQGPLTAEENQWLAKAYRQDVNGWIYLHTEGAPFERGFQRGYLTADENADFLKTLAYTQKF
jgi:hypothetical protein